MRVKLINPSGMFQNVARYLGAVLSDRNKICDSDHAVQKTILCSSYQCEKLFLTLREEYVLQVFGRKVRKIFGPTRDEVTEQFRKLHNEELCDL
jgi:hypothetical protein